MKKNDGFRITAFRNTLRRKPFGKAEEIEGNSSLEHIQNEFRVQEALIQKRESLNDPKVYDRLGFKRHFLKVHGETKCFEKAVQFKKEKPLKPLAVKNVSTRYNASFADSAREISL